MLAINLPSLRMAINKKGKYTVKTEDRNAQVLIFDAHELAQQIRMEESINREILKSYKHKLPRLNDTMPHFSELYQKVLKDHKII